MFSAVSRQRLPLSGRIIQTSLGTTRFFPSIHLPYLLHMIPCSYRALFCRANLPSCTALYAISVRQTRGLPAGSLVPRIRFPSDSTSRWTPLPSAMSFPLPGRLGTCTLKKRAPPGAHAQKGQELFSYPSNPSSVIKSSPSAAVVANWSQRSFSGWPAWPFTQIKVT